MCYYCYWRYICHGVRHNDIFLGRSLPSTFLSSCRLSLPSLSSCRRASEKESEKPTEAKRREKEQRRCQRIWLLGASWHIVLCIVSYRMSTAYRHILVTSRDYSLTTTNALCSSFFSLFVEKAYGLLDPPKNHRRDFCQVSDRPCDSPDWHKSEEVSIFFQGDFFAQWTSLLAFLCLEAGKEHLSKMSWSQLLLL